MARLAPVSHREFIERLLALGFEGPYAGGRHEFLLRGERRLIVPNPHRGDNSPDLLIRLLRQEWEAARKRE
jgi:predicted RNA binding protein YcfA (HicA-like mRNA interferase family)